MPVVFGGDCDLESELALRGDFRRRVVYCRPIEFLGELPAGVYPVHLRGTGESFAANIGGRLIGTSFAWVTATLAVTPDRAYAPTKVALVAAGVGFSVYLVGFIASFFLPEPTETSCPTRATDSTECN